MKMSGSAYLVFRCLAGCGASLFTMAGVWKSFECMYTGTKLYFVCKQLLIGEWYVLMFDAPIGRRPEC